MPLPDRAAQVLDLLVQKGIGERPLLFICHSLGGLLTKQILRKSSDAAEPRKQGVAKQTRAILFLATPHAGAALASLLNAFRTLFGSTVSIEDLREHDAHLRDLFNWYRNYASQVPIRTITYYEMCEVKGLLPIVSPSSAHPGVGSDPIGLDEDHLSIAKPRDRDAQVCGAARELVRDFVLAARPSVLGALAPPPLEGSTAAREVVIKLDTHALGGNGALVDQPVPATTHRDQLSRPFR